MGQETIVTSHSHDEQSEIADKPAEMGSEIRTLGSDANGGRDDTLDEDLNRERLEPGLDSAGKGSAGADPSKPRGPENSNT